MSQAPKETEAPEETQTLLVDRLARKYEILPEAFLGSLRATVFHPGKDKQGHPLPPFTDMEMAAALVLADQYDLNPFSREIYVTRGQGQRLLVIIPIDGWTKLANRSTDYDGVEFEFEDTETNGKPDLICWCTIYLKNRSKPVRVPEYLSECVRKTGPWESHPRRMLRHKAFIQAARIAFGLSAVDDDEADGMGVRVPDFVVTSNQDLPGADKGKPRRRRKTAKLVTSGDGPKSERGSDKVPEPGEETPDEPELPPGLTEAAEQMDLSPTSPGGLVNQILLIAEHFDEPQWKEIYAAAGVDVITTDCTLAELEAGLRKAEEIAGGERE